MFAVSITLLLFKAINYSEKNVNDAFVFASNVCRFFSFCSCFFSPLLVVSVSLDLWIFISPMSRYFPFLSFPKRNKSEAFHQKLLVSLQFVFIQFVYLFIFFFALFPWDVHHPGKICTNHPFILFPFISP